MRLARSCPARLVLALACAAALAAEGTDNHVLRALPAPAKVVIDGDLGEWDRSGRIVVCPQVPDLIGAVSAEVHAVWDAEALYLGIAWTDATPMVNDYHPDLDIDRRKCFHSDSVQLHVRTDVERKVIAWFHQRSGRAAAISLDSWMPWGDNPIVYHDAMAERGVEQAFIRDAAGYAQELRIPWSALVASGRAYGAGEGFDAMLDLVWGPDNGKGWPSSHHMDLVQPGSAHGGWFWEVDRIYGRIELLAAGNVTPVAAPTAAPAPIADVDAISVRATPPADAAYVALALEDERGRRVRALAGDAVAAVRGADGSVGFAWDGLDDHGKPIAPGRYHVVGRARGEVTATYEQCFYNPGTPPWPTADGTGAWGGDHSPPTALAALDDGGVAIAWAGVEGGSGVIAVDRAGRKRWGCTQASRALAVDGEAIYMALDDAWSGRRGIGRLDARDGAYQPWAIGGAQVMPFDLGAALGRAGATVDGIAAHAGALVAIVQDEMVALGGDDLRLGARRVLPRPSHPAFLGDGTLIALLDGRPHRIDLAAGTTTPLGLDGCERASALTCAGDDIAVFDLADQRIEVYGVDGRLRRSAGRAGGRARRGPFDAQTMAAVSSLAIDGEGRSWACESHELPRRVSVWGRDGALARDYVGNGAYAGGGSFLHDQDPELAYVGAVELWRDPAARTWGVASILWDPDAARGERLPILPSGLATPQRCARTIDGARREYLVTRSDWGDAGEPGPVLYLERADGWKPCAAITLVGWLSGGFGGRTGDRTCSAMPDGEFAGCDVFDAVFWHDADGDGLAQRRECEIVPSEKPAKAVGGRGAGPLPMSTGWGTRLGDDLTLWIDGLVAYRPIAIDEHGAPRYGTAAMERLPIADRGDLVPLDRERRLVVVSSTGYGGDSHIAGYDYDGWGEAWRLPSRWHGVHGSHKAPLPIPGVVMGALKVVGSAPLPDGTTVVALRGNLGQDFLITSDGFCLGALFHDCRMPTPGLPPREEDLVGKRIDDRSLGGEPFNGWFGRQDDGVVRVVTGLAREAGMVARVDGLDTFTRFDAGWITIDAAAIARASRTPLPTASARPRATLRRATPHVDGDLADWSGEPAAIGERGAWRVAYDDQKLYAAWSVRDDSPWRNHGRDRDRLFKTGDAVDLQIAVVPDAGDAVGEAHRRVLIAPFGDGLACLLMRPVDPAADPDQAVVYRSPIGERRFAAVAPLAGVEVVVTPTADGYVVEAALPLAALGLTPKPGTTLRADVGIVSSDADGIANVARTYWANATTGLVDDLPSESWLEPAAWGELTVE